MCFVLCYGVHHYFAHKMMFYIQVYCYILLGLELGVELWCFSYTMAVSFIGGGNQSIKGKHMPQVNENLYYIILHRVHSQ